MRLSRRGAKFIGAFEGFRPCTYLDPVGIATIGFGTTGHEARPGRCISRSKALRYLRKDARAFGEVIADNVRVKLNQNEYDALVSFVYNVGPGAFAGSTLLAILNQANVKPQARRLAADQLLRWDKAGETVLPGLTRRRRAERRLFLRKTRKRRKRP